MVNHKYSMAAKQLANRNQRRLNPSIDPIEKETDELFYWIMSLLENSVQSYRKAKPFHSVTVNEGIAFKDDEVCLKDEKGNIYMSKYVRTKQEFYDIMKNIAETFEEMGETLEPGCRFGAICFTEEGKAQLTVNMTASNI